MQDPQNKPSRRGFFLAAGVASAAVTAVAVLPGQQALVPAALPQDLPPPPDKGGGYTLSEHVKRYYKTTRV